MIEFHRPRRRLCGQRSAGTGTFEMSWRVTSITHGTQLPLLHCSPAAQVRPQAPQLSTSLLRLTQPPAQQVSPPLQAAPPLHAQRELLPCLAQRSPGRHSVAAQRQRPSPLQLVAGVASPHCSGAVHPQSPLRQENPLVQLVPQAPQ
jgi:hypothetical protein